MNVKNSKYVVLHPRFWKKYRKHQKAATSDQAPDDNQFFQRWFNQMMFEIETEEYYMHQEWCPYCGAWWEDSHEETCPMVMEAEQR